MRSPRSAAPLALGFLLLAGEVTGDRISFDSREAWQAWTMPVGAVEVTARGQIRLVPVRKGIDAVADAADFGGGIRGAGSNVADAALLMDGDVSTAWKPRSADDTQDWWVELDLGRVVTADEIRIRLAEDADPLQFLRVLISNGEPVFTNALVPVAGTLVFGKSERFGFNDEYELVIPLRNEPVRVVRLEALEKTEGAGVAEIVVRTPGDNISLGLIERGGSIVLDTDQQQILSGAERIADGDLVTFWAMTVYHQTQGDHDVFNRIIFDLGAHYWVDRIFIVGDPVGAPINRRSRFANFFWYQIFVSDGSLASDGSLRWEEVAFQPNLPENTIVTRRFDHTFDLRKIRHLRHFFPSSDGGQRAGYERFGLISEYQVYGEGFPAEVQLTSPLIDLGQRSNVTAVTWDSDQPEGTRLEVRSRTGDEIQEEEHFFNKSGKEITQRKWEKTPSSLRGPVEVTRAVGSDWSIWSDPYVVSGEYFRSPSPRRYTQLQVRLMSDDPAVAPTLSALHLDVGSPMAVETRGEIYPAVVKPGEESEFTYFMRPRFDAASQGVDRLQLVASVPLEFTRLTVGERLVDADVESRADGFVVKLPQRLWSDELVQISFRSTIYQNQTRFDLFLGNSALGEQIRQRVDAGDASDTIDSETISVALPVTSELLSNLTLSSRVLTPNGDGIGDRVEIEFDLLMVMTPRPVEAAVYDLAGRRVRTLALAGATAGHHVLSWDGRDGGNVPVPPGTYLLRLRVEGDSGTQVFDRLLAVAY
jgi:hypothetical protein